MIAVSKHLEGNHRKEEWGFLCGRPEGSANVSWWVGSSERWHSADWNTLGLQSALLEAEGLLIGNALDKDQYKVKGWI